MNILEIDDDELLRLVSSTNDKNHRTDIRSIRAQIGDVFEERGKFFFYAVEVTHDGFTSGWPKKGEFRSSYSKESVLAAARERAALVDRRWSLYVELFTKKQLDSLLTRYTTAAENLNISDAVIQVLKDEFPTENEKAHRLAPTPPTIEMPRPPQAPEDFPAPEPLTLPEKPEITAERYRVVPNSFEKFLLRKSIRNKEIELRKQFEIDYAAWMEKVGEIKKINTENERIYAQKLMLDRAKYTSELEWYESGKAKYDAAIKQYQNDLSSYERDINDESISRRNRIKLRRDEIYKQYFEEHHFETSVKILAKLFAQGTEETIYFANDSNTALFFLLYSAWLSADFNNKILAVNFKLPLIDDIPTVIDVKELKTSDDVKEKRMTTAARERFYDDVLYKICLGSIHLLFAADKSNFFDAVVFNGYVDYIDKATGKDARAFIMSLQTTKQEFNNIDLLRIDPKTCFKSLKGVGSSKLYSITPIRPILNISKEDARFVDAVDVASSIDASTNLAAIDWQEFEQLIRQVFDKEFSQNGGEVKITQASRDGGVDAVAFDNDPIRGGKIVIQAKRYTNTVGVSAVRDLYGTVMNEGAMKGILVTTSDFGPDAHSFAKDKPLTLISGAELLYLFQKHGYEARINLQEAKAEAAQKANSSTK